MLNFENLDGFVVDLTSREEVEYLYSYVYDYADDELHILSSISLEFMRHSLLEFYTSHYPYVFCTKPNVYFICEEELTREK